MVIYHGKKKNIPPLKFDSSALKSLLSITILFQSHQFFRGKLVKLQGCPLLHSSSLKGGFFQKVTMEF